MTIEDELSHIIRLFDKHYVSFSLNGGKYNLQPRSFFGITNSKFKMLSSYTEKMWKHNSILCYKLTVKIITSRSTDCFFKSYLPILDEYGIEAYANDYDDSLFPSSMIFNFKISNVQIDSLESLNSVMYLITFIAYFNENFK